MSGSKSSDGSFARAASLPPEARAEHPLGLTVHTLPEAGEAVATAQRARHGRWKMLGVLLICAAPVVASYFTYYVIRPEGRRVYGELINPQRTCLRSPPPRSMAGPSGWSPSKAYGCW